jgi:hypothetical protein
MSRTADSSPLGCPGNALVLYAKTATGSASDNSRANLLVRCYRYGPIEGRATRYFVQYEAFLPKCIYPLIEVLP